MKSLFCILILICQPLCLMALPTIVMLYGSGSAGKTSLGQEVAKQDPSWIVIDEDDIYTKQWIEIIAERFPYEYNEISHVIAQQNIYNAIKNNLILFNDNASPYKRSIALNYIKIIQETFIGKIRKYFRKEFYKEFENRTIETIIKGLEANKNVLLDRWYISSDKLETIFPDSTILKALVFSPLGKSIEKLNKRNLESKLSKNNSNSRYYDQVIPSFVSIYQITDSPKEALFVCRKSELEKIFDKISLNLKSTHIDITNTALYRELTNEELQKYKEELIPPQLSSDAILYISPKEQYDFIISTEKNTPSEAATELLNKLKRLP